MPSEQWRPCTHQHHGLQVSNLGRVRDENRKVLDRRLWKPHDSDSWALFFLVNGIIRGRVARLVLNTFDPLPRNVQAVRKFFPRYRRFDKLDCRRSNLYWALRITRVCWCCGAEYSRIQQAYGVLAGLRRKLDREAMELDKRRNSFRPPDVAVCARCYRDTDWWDRLEYLGDFLHPSSGDPSVSQFIDCDPALPSLAAEGVETTWDQRRGSSYKSTHDFRGIASHPEGGRPKAAIAVLNNQGARDMAKNMANNAVTGTGKNHSAKTPPCRKCGTKRNRIRLTERNPLYPYCSKCVSNVRTPLRNKGEPSTDKLVAGILADMVKAAAEGVSHKGRRLRTATGQLVARNEPCEYCKKPMAGMRGDRGDKHCVTCMGNTFRTLRRNGWDDPENFEQANRLLAHKKHFRALGMPRQKVTTLSLAALKAEIENQLPEVQVPEALPDSKVSTGPKPLKIATEINDFVQKRQAKRQRRARNGNGVTIDGVEVVVKKKIEAEHKEAADKQSAREIRPPSKDQERAKDLSRLFVERGVLSHREIVQRIKDLLDDGKRQTGELIELNRVLGEQPKSFHDANALREERDTLQRHNAGLKDDYDEAMETADQWQRKSVADTQTLKKAIEEGNAAENKLTTQLAVQRTSLMGRVETAQANQRVAEGKLSQCESRLFDVREAWDKEKAESLKAAVDTFRTEHTPIIQMAPPKTVEQQALGLAMQIVTGEDPLNRRAETLSRVGGFYQAQATALSLMIPDD